MTINLVKKLLRNEMKSIIEAIEIQERQIQGEKVFQKLTALPQYKESKRVSLFLSTKDEIDTIQLLRDLFRRQKEVFVPRYEGSEMQMVKLYSMSDYEQLPLTKWKIKQPDTSENREDALETGGLDLIIVPGVAFTRDGKRLGHGGGYYDRYLQDYVKAKGRKPNLIAIAFNEQICKEIPTSELDHQVDLVLTERHS
ncbi:5-formyltetrahydrofolate cyclo-ligase [Belonocnema kinseyi]|uniref:5-formyltetrahydrofolate cyclo-ligase n=1 Tax=Belonocnema kinseyi TaxID=2817044 RepID=UPI00143D4436|nr:5-formyltetrahydrofolate cyclo-ligase [Belonocnema kinseyi]